MAPRAAPTMTITIVMSPEPPSLEPVSERLEGGHVDHRPLTNKVSPRAILVLSRVGLYTFGLRVLRGPVHPLDAIPFYRPYGMALAISCRRCTSPRSRIGRVCNGHG